jgi:catechol 2,3-dioxygenase-like lactoylglutathione lyase family enzyme
VNEPDQQQWVQALKQAHMNTVAMTVYAYQGDWDSDGLWINTESDHLLNEVRSAKAEGLHVVLVLRIALDHNYSRNKFLWHGLIMPLADDALERWFAKYTEFMEYWAAFAQQEGIDILAIGSELSTLTSTLSVERIPGLAEYYMDTAKQAAIQQRILGHRDVIEERHLQVKGFQNYSDLDTFLTDEQMVHAEWARRVTFYDSPDPIARINARRQKLDGLWRQLIRRIRMLYTGQLTYAANFDQYTEVGFWDELDIISINAYFPLRKTLLASHEEYLLEEVLRTGWSQIFGGIDHFSRQHGLQQKPILFTEIGYTSRKNSTIEPWASQGISLIPSPEGEQAVIWQDQPEYPQERALALKTLYDVTRNRRHNLFIGLLYWKLSSIPDHRDIEPFVAILDETLGDPVLERFQAFTKARPIQIHHLSLYTNDLESLKAFYTDFLNARPGEKQTDPHTGDEWYWLDFGSGIPLQIVQRRSASESHSNEAFNGFRITVSVGSPQRVDDIVRELQAQGHTVLSAPQSSSESYSSVVFDPDGNRVQIME